MAWVSRAIPKRKVPVLKGNEISYRRIDTLLFSAFLEHYRSGTAFASLSMIQTWGVRGVSLLTSFIHFSKVEDLSCVCD